MDFPIDHGGFPSFFVCLPGRVVNGISGVTDYMGYHGIGENIQWNGCRLVIKHGLKENSKNPYLFEDHPIKTLFIEDFQLPCLITGRKHEENTNAVWEMKGRMVGG